MTVPNRIEHALPVAPKTGWPTGSTTTKPPIPTTVELVHVTLGTAKSLADATFFGADAAVWSAWGIWITIAVYIVIALVAFQQLSESRRMRAEQTRPFVIVDVHFRSILVELIIENVGTTAARDVKVSFDEPVQSAIGPEPDWQHSTAFKEGIPMMAPGRRIRFIWDSYPTRRESELPMVMRGTVIYSGPSDTYNDRFVIDLSVYEGSAVSEPGIPEIAKSLEEIRSSLKSLVSVADRHDAGGPKATSSSDQASHDGSDQ